MTAVDPVRSISGMLARSIVATALVLATTASAVADESEPRDRWTKTDTILEVAVVTSLAVDYLQTRRLMQDGLESNHLLSQGHISPGAYFLTAAAAHVLVARMLPAGRWRTAFQGVVLGAEINAIENNWSAGYGIRF